MVTSGPAAPLLLPGQRRVVIVAHWGQEERLPEVPSLLAGLDDEGHLLVPVVPQALFASRGHERVDRGAVARFLLDGSGEMVYLGDDAFHVAEADCVAVVEQGTEADRVGSGRSR